MAALSTVSRQITIGSSLFKTGLPMRKQFTPLIPRISPVATAHSQIRYSTYSGPALAENGKPRKKVTIQTLQNLYKKGEPIAMLTAHDFPSAHVADASGMDILLVGDSLGMVALGLENTTEVVMDEMVLHCRSVARAAKSAFIVSMMVPSKYTKLTFPCNRSAICRWAHTKFP